MNSQQPMKRYMVHKSFLSDKPEEKQVGRVPVYLAAEVEAVEAEVAAARIVVKQCVDMIEFPGQLEDMIVKGEKTLVLMKAFLDNPHPAARALLDALVAKEARIVELEEESRQWEKESLCKLLHKWQEAGSPDELAELKRQAKQPSLAAKTAYINGLQTHIARVRVALDSCLLYLTCDSEPLKRQKHDALVAFIQAAIQPERGEKDE